MKHICSNARCGQEIPEDHGTFHLYAHGSSGWLCDECGNIKSPRQKAEACIAELEERKELHAAAAKDEMSMTDSGYWNSGCSSAFNEALAIIRKAFGEELS